MTSEEVRALLKAKAVPTQAAFAKENNISPQYVNDVIKGRREPGPGVLDALGLEQVITYRRKATK